MDLETIQDNAWFALGNALKSISEKTDAERTGRAHGVAAFMYHRLALCELLAEARTDRFQVLLCKSALARVSMLRLATSRRFEPILLCGSRNFSFVDAVAAGQLDVAAELARLSPDRHEPRCEYEDDFLLHRFMQKRLLHLHLHMAEDHDFQAMLERWAHVVEGEHAPYLDVCRALLLRDAETFHTALLASGEERARLFRKKDAYPEDARRTDGAVFMNGLALLRLAELSGMPTQREYPNIPDMARLPVGTLPLPLDIWMRPDAGLPT
ncbi:hypothetical protein OV208_33100 [Corallococcus sp. bb12-1]|uniref:Imm49 family immunity protein n=1 Tax=Corallococcus sp. bb12-1 TaxID=2996784 RepID=UPI00226EAD05|nr:hypothetical protein [Corallococcus sp. bb12-1]MCY1046196.1 hypothetical protein [Corallococcus sp. bb12-1]